MEGAGLVSNGRMGIKRPRRRGWDCIISKRDLGRPVRKKASGYTSGYSASGGIGR
jgi:hypothetical protein